MKLTLKRKTTIATIMVVVLAVVLVISVSKALADNEWDSFRCNGNIVEKGDYAFIVAQKCVDTKLVHKEILSVVGEHWVYDLGTYYYYLKFYDGKLVNIESFRK